MIKQRGSRWRVVVQARPDPATGRRRQLSGSAATRKEAVELERRLMRQVEAGVANPTIAEVVEEAGAGDR